MRRVNTPRLNDRVLTFEECFEASKMEAAWKNYVKEGMRGQTLLDLHDYFDFHRHKTQILRSVSNQIKEGVYRPKPHYEIVVEKKLGVSRHQLIPSPEDAVVLQSIVESISPIITNAQPSDRAYYSRSHAGPKSEADIDETFPYAWWELWPKFQEKIYEFTQTFDYVVISDISNYFDNIIFRQLRNVLASYGRIDETLLDFLFYMIEAFVWRPDYLPLSGMSLPQLNYDAPRLLGHSFLFEIDKYLHEKTNGNFVRWMDDIDFGVNHVHEAKEILRGLDELLLTRGIRLNMGKTKVLSMTEAENYFLPNENRFITIMSKRVKRLVEAGSLIDTEKIMIRKRFRSFYKKQKVGRWDKILGRYFSLSAITNDKFLQKLVPDILSNQPGLRNQVFRYYKRLGPGKPSFQHLSEFLIGQDCFDDPSIFGVAKVLIDWKLTPGHSLRREILHLAQRTAGRSATNFIASLWMIAKYGSSQELASYVDRYSNIWKHSSFLSRQVAAVLPRIKSLPGQYNIFKKRISEAGQLDALRVLDNLNDLCSSQRLSSSDKLYILHGQTNYEVYPLQKYLIAYELLSSGDLDQTYRQDLRNELVTRINDPIYRRELNNILIQ
ncbi:RNA-directed DNA polymerase [Paenibacillus polymyxa]|uniref:RNA-directed DNA polymerase n=1 Tax=Paenibacillus polymyxa TaxID=1406 RepID=UPI0003D3B317|nr:RNA-directed DNA polymerase [Paenibacillus polymyxa]AIW40966.1 hypothetical protein X809_33735 [Paenibacillus polymyxa CR1]